MLGGGFRRTVFVERLTYAENWKAKERSDANARTNFTKVLFFFSLTAVGSAEEVKCMLRLSIRCSMCH